MARKYIEKEAIRTLFAKTGNQCAYPKCHHPLVEEDGSFVAQVCHIEAAEPGGQRYNAAMSDDDRRSPSNLIVLCYRHHIRTNDVAIYTAEALRRMKADHEGQWFERAYSVPDAAIEQIIEDELSYWLNVEMINAEWVQKFDLAMEIPKARDPIKYLEAIAESVDWCDNLLSDLSLRLSNLPSEISIYFKSLGYDTSKFEEVKYYENPFHNIHWASLNIGVCNSMLKIRMHLLLLNIHLLYQALKNSPGNVELETELTKAKASLQDLATSAGYAD